MSFTTRDVVSVLQITCYEYCFDILSFLIKCLQIEAPLVKLKNKVKREFNHYKASVQIITNIFTAHFSNYLLKALKKKKGHKIHKYLSKMLTT